MKHIVVYRGPLERSRVAFVLRVVEQLGLEYEFVWIFPGRLSKEQTRNFEIFMNDFSCNKVHVLEMVARDILRTRALIKRITGGDVGYLFAVGFSAKYFLPMTKPGRTIWCINGIPEEDAFSSRITGSFVARLKWWATRPGTVDRIIAVSEPMARYVSRHHSIDKILVAPTCVDLELFSSRLEEPVGRRYFAYLGTGAPWQALDMLSGVWREIHRLDPSIVFRVITRDPRAGVLREGIDTANIDFVGSDNFEEVAAYLSECEAGFLLRRPSIVNEVSYPTKVGEYLAAGAWVVTSAIGWDVERLITDTGAGVVLPYGSSNEEAARAILGFRSGVSSGAVCPEARAAAELLGQARWVRRTAEAISSSHPT